MESLELKVMDVIASNFSVSIDEINGEIGPGDLVAWDSIGQLRLILDLEKTFDIQLSVDDVMLINNINDIINIIGKYLDKSENTSIESDQAKKTVISHYQPLRIPLKTYWGIDSISALKQINLKNVFVLTGSSEYSNKIFKKIESLLFADNISITRFQRSQGEPNEKDILILADALKKFSPEDILAIGGGSTIDTAKLALLLFENPDLELSEIDYINEEVKIQGSTNLIAVPTTFGSGSEISSAAAYSKQNEFCKTIIVSHSFIPNTVILDPRLGEDLSKPNIFSSAIDALTHSIEGFVSLIDVPILDSIAVQTILDIIQNINIIDIEKNIDIKILERLCYSSYYAGMIQNHCSVGLTHSFSHQLGSFGIGHGVANAMFLLPIIEFNSSKEPVYDDLAKKLGFLTVDNFKKEINSLLKNVSIMPEKDTLLKILDNKENIVDGAMKDITFRTNPIRAEKNELEIIFQSTVENLINE